MSTYDIIFRDGSLEEVSLLGAMAEVASHLVSRRENQTKVMS
jgi:hypothetical protein